MVKVKRTEDGVLLFYCEGCEETHGVTNAWNFNGDFEKPTFTPSILVRSTELTEKGEADYEAWCAAGYPPRDGKPLDHIKTTCHSFVTDGRIQYLGDCTHKLVGQTVELKGEEDWFEV